MREEAKEAITKHLYSMLSSISHLLKYEAIEKDLEHVKISCSCMTYNLKNINKIIEEEVKPVKE